jgi:LysM repeat protein
MIEPGMPARRSARLFAPLALLAALVALVVVVGGSSSSSSTSASKAHRSSDGGPRSGSVARRLPSRRSTRRVGAFYTVKSTDTLTSVAASTHVPLATLQELNPKVDPQAMHAGQRLKLR